MDKRWVNCGMVGVSLGVAIIVKRDTGAYRTRNQIYAHPSGCP